MLTVETLIQNAGGADVVAAGCNVTPDATRKWREAGAIPSRHWMWFSGALGMTLDQVAAVAKPKRKAA